MGRVSVVLITFHSAAYLPRCLSGIQQQTPSDLELIVVDNASADDSLALISGSALRPTVIRNDVNRGFAAAANQGIRASTGEFVTLLNPDVYLEPEYILALRDELQHRGGQWGAATGKLLRGKGTSIEPTGIIDSKGIRMTRSGRHLDIGSGQPDRDEAPEPVEVFGVSGAAAMYRREFLNDVAIDGEYFDEDFFVYREDADLAWRARLLGWRALYVPKAIAYHVRRVTPEVRGSLPPELNLHSVKNRFLLRVKNEGAYLALRNAPFELARDLMVFGATLTVERSSFPAWRWLWRNRRRIRQKRQLIQQRRRVADRELARWFR